MQDEKYLKIPFGILRNTELTECEKIVLAEIDYLSPCTKSNQNLADTLGMPKQKLTRTIKKLIEKNFIQVEYSSPVKKTLVTSIKIDTTKNDTSIKTNTIKNDTSVKNDSSKNDTSNGIKIDPRLVSNLTQTSIKIDTQDNRDKDIDKGGDNARAREDSPTAVPDEVLKAYQDGIRPVCSSIELEKLADDVKHFGSGAVVKAIERAVLRNKRSLAYIEAILRSWETDGYDAAEKDVPKPEPPPKIVYEDETPEYQEWLERQKLIEDIKKNGAAHYPEWLPKKIIEEIKNGARQNQES